jgi:hypothetical protein
VKVRIEAEVGAGALYRRDGPAAPH